MGPPSEKEPSGWFRHPDTRRRRPEGDPYLGGPMNRKKVAVSLVLTVLLALVAGWLLQPVVMAQGPPTCQNAPGSGTCSSFGTDGCNKTTNGVGPGSQGGRCSYECLNSQTNTCPCYVISCQPSGTTCPNTNWYNDSCNGYVPCDCVVP
jgi:hypothetical protein